MMFSTLQEDVTDSGADSPSISPDYLKLPVEDVEICGDEGVVLVADSLAGVPNETTWALYRYNSKVDQSGGSTPDSLANLSRADADNRNFSSSHTFTSGSARVIVPNSMDIYNAILDIFPGTTTDNAIARWGGTSGDVLQDSAPTIDDDGNLNMQSHGVGSVEHYDREYIAAPGEIQTAIDAAATEADANNITSQPTALVRLEPGEVYDPSSMITIKEGVVLDCSGAYFEITSDIDVFYLEGLSQLLNINGHVNTSYTSNFIRVDTGAGYWDGKYACDTNYSQVIVTGNINGHTNGGTGLYLNDAGSYGITVGCRFNLNISKFKNGLLVDGGTGSWVNGITANLTLALNRYDFHQVGNVGFQSEVYGIIQNGGTYNGNNCINIYNETTNVSINFFGRLWDPKRGNTVIDGEKITVMGPGLNEVDDYCNTTSSIAINTMYYPGFELINLDNGQKLSFQPDTAQAAWELFDGDGNQHGKIKDGQIIIGGASNLVLWEHTSEPTVKNRGMLALADGSTWNPGSGRGIYLYDEDTGSWDFVGG